MYTLCTLAFFFQLFVETQISIYDLFISQKYGRTGHTKTIVYSPAFARVYAGINILQITPFTFNL